jgi:hypothetical protein
MKSIVFWIFITLISFQIFSKHIIYQSDIYLGEKKLLVPALLNNDEKEKLAKKKTRSFSSMSSREKMIFETNELIENSESSEIQYLTKEGILYTNGRFKFEFEGEDEESGHFEIEYSMNNSKFKKYSGPIPVINHGINLIHYRSIDLVGNIEKNNSINFFVDTIPPSLEIRLQGKSYKNNNILYYSPSLKFHIITEDEDSGVLDTYLNVNNEGFAPQKFLIEEFKESNNFFVRVTALDRVQNKSREQQFTFSIDADPPRIDIESYKIIQLDDKQFCSNKTTFKIKAFDEHSGIQSVMYKINNSDWERYIEEIQIPNHLTHLTIEAKAIDNVNNESSIQVFSCSIDNKAPKTNIDIKK